MSRRKWILNNNSDYNTVRTNGFCADIVKDLIREKRRILDHYEDNGFDHPKTIELLDNFFSRFASYTDNMITNKDLKGE